MRFKKIKLRKGEKVLEFEKQCFISQLPQMFFGTVFLALPFVFIVPLFDLGRWGAIGFFVAISVVGLVEARWLFTWYHTIFVVTNHRVIDVDQQGFFNVVVSEALLEKIQDVSSFKRGLMQTLFNYGLVEIQTAGTNLTLEIDGVSNPIKFQQMLNQVKQRRLDEKGVPQSLSLSQIDFESLLDSEITALFFKMEKQIGRQRMKKIIKKLWNQAGQNNNL